MKFATIREFRSKTAAMRKSLEREQEIILTSKGRPVALVTRLNSDTVEEELKAIRLARFRVAVDQIRAEAKASGVDKMTMKEINAIIAEARREKRASK